MLDLDSGQALVAMARWGPEVHQQSVWNYRPEDGAPVSALVVLGVIGALGAARRIERLLLT
jgi:hypothetical protein